MGPSVVPQGVSRVGLIAVTVAALAEVLRAAFPQFGQFAAAHGAASAVVVAVVCLAGFLAPLLRAVAGPRTVLVAGVGGLLAARLADQVFGSPVWLAIAGTALGMLAVAALYELARGLSGTGFAVAAVAGLTMDTAVRLAFGTWDPATRSGPLPILVGLVIVGIGAAGLIRQVRSAPAEAPWIGWRDALGAAALGPFLALQILVLANPAFVASNGWMSLPAAGVTVLAGQAIALAFLASGLAVQAVPGGVCVLGGTFLGVGAAAVTGTYGLAGHLTTPVIIVGQLLAAWLFAVASRVPLRMGSYRVPSDHGPGSRSRTAWRIDMGAALGAFLAAAVPLAYQAHYLHPLPVANKMLPGAAGILLGVLSAIAAARGGPLPARSWLRALGAGGAALVLLVVPGLWALTAPATAVTVPAGPRAGTFRLVGYEIHDAVDRDGRVDLEAIARAIEAQHADVAALQDVGRGWTVAGSADAGEWLARRLRMRLVWGPAADNQSGNAILTRLPVRATGYGRLPLGAGPQVDGYVWARLDVGAGRTVDVWSVRLQRGADRRQTRLGEIARLVQAWSGAPRTVISGDMNAGPGSPEITRLTGQTGLSAPADGAPVTTVNGRRIDWLVSTSDLGLTGYAAAGSAGSGHLPVTASVRLVG